MKNIQTTDTNIEQNLRHSINYHYPTQYEKTNLNGRIIYKCGTLPVRTRNRTD